MKSAALPIIEGETGDAPQPRTGEYSILNRDIHLVELLDIEAFQEVCASFVDLYKIGIKIFDSNGSKLVDMRAGNVDWCGYIYKNSTGRSKCTSLVGKIKRHAYPGLDEGEYVEQTCFSGLKYVIMPVEYGGELLGRVIYGPFLPADLQKPGAEIYDFGEGFDPGLLWSYGSKIRRAPDETVLKILRTFRGVVNTIVFVAMRAVMTEQLHVESITASYNELSTANRNLRGSLEKLKQLDRLKSNFLAMISHELRTPLTSVIGYTEMLLDGMAGELNQQQHSFAQMIKGKGEALLALIGNLLDMSKIEAGAMQLSITEIDIPELFDSSASYIVPQVQKKSIELAKNCAQGLPVLRGDAAKLRQCLVNLLGNAVKFTPEGGRISMVASLWRGVRRAARPDERFGVPESDFLRIDVKDTGIGIPKQKLENVFRSFYQVDGGITREYGGTGLGLAIVKRFVEAHGGDIRVDSQEGVGSVFSIFVPFEGTGEGVVEMGNLGDP